MNVQETYVLSPVRQLTDEEKTLVWKKPSSHQISEEEQRICKEATLQMKQLMKRAVENTDGETVEYRFYPSEIVRAFQKGYLLEIQEPNVIRDAAVLMALNSALELDGSMNLPTEIIHRHPDFIAVITTNRQRGHDGTRDVQNRLSG